MTTSLYVSVRPEEFVGCEGEVGEGLAYVGSARAYVTGSIGRGGRVSDGWSVLIVFFVTMTTFSTLVSIRQVELEEILLFLTAGLS
jgi:hypothetical protein